MSWDSVFGLSSLWPLPFWLLLAFGPRNELTGKIILFGGILPLAALYAAMFPLLFAGVLDPGGAALPSASEMTQLSGVMAFFDSKAGAVGGWIHYLAFDLFVGLWIARNADRHGFHRAVQLLPIILTWLVGPVGLFLYLLIRLTCKNPPENAAVPC